jgi:hypothetical protein
MPLVYPLILNFERPVPLAFDRMSSPSSRVPTN